MLFHYLRDKKKRKEERGLRKRRGENSPISPPLDPRLGFTGNDIPFLAAQGGIFFFQIFITRLTNPLNVTDTFFLLSKYFPVLY